MAQAEEAAEQSVLEYLTENYEVEAELAIGKNLLPYNPHITYPAGAHFYIEDKIYQTLRTINGVKAPEAAPYWAEYDDSIEDESSIESYTQRRSYEPGDIVRLEPHILNVLNTMALILMTFVSLELRHGSL